MALFVSNALRGGESPSTIGSLRGKLRRHTVGWWRALPLSLGTCVGWLEKRVSGGSPACKVAYLSMDVAGHHGANGAPKLGFVRRLIEFYHEGVYGHANVADSVLCHYEIIRDKVRATSCCGSHICLYRIWGWKESKEEFESYSCIQNWTRGSTILSMIHSQSLKCNQTDRGVRALLKAVVPLKWWEGSLCGGGRWFMSSFDEIDRSTTRACTSSSFEG